MELQPLGNDLTRAIFNALVLRVQTVVEFTEPEALANAIMRGTFNAVQNGAQIAAVFTVPEHGAFATTQATSNAAFFLLHHRLPQVVTLKDALSHAAQKRKT